jgi:hypothetical protein
MVETLQSFALYIKLIFVPTGLHMERTLAGVPTYAAGIGAALLVSIAVLAVYCYRTNRRRAALGFGWFLVMWLPISGLFPLNAPMAEHWMYVPLAGFIWGLAELAHEAIATRARGVRWTAAAVLGMWVVVLISMTALRNLDWRSNESLYVATLRMNPESTRVQFNLGVVYQDLLDNPRGAIRHFENVTSAYRNRKLTEPDSATRFWSDELEAYLSLGDLYRSMDRIDQAMLEYQTLLTVQPDARNTAIVAHAAYGLGRCYLAIGEYAAAMTAFRRAAQLAPELGAAAQDAIDREAPLAAFATPPANANQ